MNFKKSLLFFVLLSMFTLVAYAEEAPDISAPHAIIVNAETGDILYEKAAHEQAYPASMTKMMTAYIAMTQGNMDDTVTVSKEALAGLSEMGSGANFQVGQTYTLHDLMYFLLISSGNDAANVVAEHIAGSQEKFVDLMNETAKSLGMENTHFANPHGLHEEDHYTSAYDMYLLASAARKIDMFREVTSTPRAEVAGHELLSTNHLISRYKDPSYYYSYATGIKTGFTTPAGYCLTSSAEKGGTTYIAVVMGCEKNADGRIMSFVDSKALYEWAFANFSEKAVLDAGSPTKEVSVALSKTKDYLVLVTASELRALVGSDFDTEDLTYTYDIPDKIEAPIEKDEKIGTVTVTYGDRTLGTVDLIALNAVERSGYLYFISRIKAFFTHPITVIVLIVLVILFILFILNMIFKNRRRRRMRYRSRYRRY